ncbi:MAG: type II toxin-antitoxin system RelE/ParE family toxin [Lachnospiraceae bacterium]|nr:type II toxin-antitoxin system RelE/ParE family toxin [Lachnospiraceae bacterium]
MKLYSILMTPDSAENLREIRNYIADVLLEPGTALEYIQSIRRKIETFQSMPERVIPVPDEPWHSLGIRRLSAKRFYIYYRIDEAEKKVYILNVIYQGRDQQSILKEMDFED